MKTESANPARSAMQELAADKSTRRRAQLRLAISIPAMMALLTLAFGLVSYQLFDRQWTQLDRLGAGAIAAELLTGHLVAMIALCIIGAGAGLVLAFTILRPIRAVQEAARRIVEGGRNERAPNSKSVGELSGLSGSFNSLVDFLNQSIQERDRFMVESLQNGLLTVDEEGRVTALNVRGAELLEIDSSIAVGTTVQDLRHGLTLKHTPFWSFVGEIVDENSARWRDRPAHEICSGRRAFIVTVSVLRGAGGEASGLMFNFRDGAQMESLNEQLNLTDQLATLGTLSMGLAHELRNPLGSIKGMVQLLALEDALPEEDREITQRILREVNRLELFVRELLDLVNPAPAQLSRTDLNAVLRTSLENARAQFDPAGEKYSVSEELAELPLVACETERIVQAFSNLLRNAFEEAEPGSTIAVRSRTVTKNGREVVETEVFNTGTQVRADHLERIFEPFFSTKKGGSGLGLPIAAQILRQNQATLACESGAAGVSFIASFTPAEGHGTALLSGGGAQVAAADVRKVKRGAHA